MEAALRRVFDIERVSRRGARQGSAALHHRRQRGRRQVHADRPPAVRFAQRLRRSDRRRREGLANQSRRSSISRCSPTACAPSASRASPSTSRTAISPRARRKFIIADTPGPRAVHAQHGHRRVHRRSRDYSDRRAQRRAAAIAPPRVHRALLGIRNFVVAVNKMDLVEYERDVFERHPRRVYGVS